MSMVRVTRLIRYLRFSVEIAMVCGHIEQPVGTMTVRKQPTPSTWKGACRAGRALNQDSRSILCMMTGSASMPGAAIRIRDNTT